MMACRERHFDDLGRRPEIALPQRPGWVLERERLNAKARAEIATTCCPGMARRPRPARYPIAPNAPGARKQQDGFTGTFEIVAAEGPRVVAEKKETQFRVTQVFSAHGTSRIAHSPQATKATSARQATPGCLAGHLPKQGNGSCKDTRGSHSQFCGV
jgi:hypothetical protein